MASERDETLEAAAGADASGAMSDETFDAAMAEWMLLIRRLLCHFYTDETDDG